MLEGLEVLFLYVAGQAFSIVANFLVLHMIASWREEEGMKQSQFRFVLYTIEWISRFWWWMRIIGCASDLIILLFFKNDFIEALGPRVMRMEPSLDQMHYVKFVVWVLNFY